MPQSFPVGQAPWETGTSGAGNTPKSFPVGQAPWESGSSPADSAVDELKKQLNPTATASHPLDQMLNTHAAAQPGYAQPAESTASFLPSSIGKAAGGLAKDLATPFTRTAGTLVSGAESLAGKAPTQEETDKMGMFKPYDTAGQALGGAAQIGLTAAPDTAEAKGLLNSANEFMKGKFIFSSQAEIDAAQQAAKEAALATREASAAKASTKAEAVATKAASKAELASKSALEKVIATPEDKVKTLSAEDRKTWFKNDQAKADAAHKELTSSNLAKEKQMSEGIVKNLQQEGEIGNKKISDLQSALENGAPGSVNELRPIVSKGITEQSKIGGRLFDEAVTGKGDTIVKKSALSDKINELLPHDPANPNDVAHVANVKEALGITDKPAMLPIAGQDETTVGKLQSQLTGLGSSKGKIPTSYDQKVAGDARRVLLEVMHDNGVDTTEARSFWSKFAPIRDQANKDFELGNQAGTKTNIGSKRLIDYAMGKDPDNKIFMDKLQEITGQPLAQREKDIVAKMTTEQKRMVAKEFETKTLKLENAETGKSERASLNKEKKVADVQRANRNSNIETAAAKRERIIGILKKVGAGLLLAGGGGEVAKHL